MSIHVLIANYGYMAVFTLVAAESLGIPVGAKNLIQDGELGLSLERMRPRENGPWPSRSSISPSSGPFRSSA
jgi:hypothetical protein